MAFLVLLVAVLANDVIARRRIHSATLFGVAVRILALVGANMIAVSELGRAFIRRLA